MIKTEELKFEYVREEDEARIIALNGVSLQIEKNSFTAVIGQNGSGKSTMAKTFNALNLPSGGKVYVAGMDTSDESLTWEIRQVAGMVFQNPDNQLVSAIVEDDVAFGPENLGLEPHVIRERVDEALKAVDMYDMRGKAPHHLSGGQKQRVAIAGVIAMRPQCVIFDEPTAMLDPRGRREVMDIIRMLHREGITVILITHFMDEAALSDRIIVMNRGKTVMDGTPSEIFRRCDELRELNLDIPVSVELAERLRKEGIAVPDDVLCPDDLIACLDRLTQIR